MAKKKNDDQKVEKSATSPWDVLAIVGGMIPGVTPLATGFARQTVQRLMGFWVMWHLYGGRRGLLSSGVMSESTVYRQINEFRRVFGQDVEDWGAEYAARLVGEGVGHEQG